MSQHATSNPWDALADGDGDWEEVPKRGQKKKKKKAVQKKGGQGRPQGQQQQQPKKKPKKKKRAGMQIPENIENKINEFKKLCKKLRQIDALNLQKCCGQKLNKDQVKKLNSREATQKQIETLRAKIPEQYMPKDGGSNHAPKQPHIPAELHTTVEAQRKMLRQIAQGTGAGGITIKSNGARFRERTLWTCEQCSYRNTSDVDVCSKCGYARLGSNMAFLNEMQRSDASGSVQQRAQAYHKSLQTTKTSNAFDLLEGVGEVSLASTRAHQGGRRIPNNIAKTHANFPTLSASPSKKKGGTVSVQATAVSKAGPAVSKRSNWASPKKPQKRKPKGISMSRWELNQPSLDNCADQPQEQEGAAPVEGAVAPPPKAKQPGQAGHPAAGSQWEGMGFTAMQKALKKLKKKEKVIGKVEKDLKLGLVVEDKDRDIYDERYSIQPDSKALQKILEKMIVGWLTAAERTNVLRKLQAKLAEIDALQGVGATEKEKKQLEGRGKLQAQYDKVAESRPMRAPGRARPKNRLSPFQRQGILKELRPLLAKLQQVEEWERRWQSNSIILQPDQFKAVQDKRYLVERIDKLKGKLA